MQNFKALTDTFARARRVVVVALFGLLLAQWTALVHSIAHAPSSQPAIASIDSNGHWTHERGTETCDLIGHLLSGHMAGGDVATMPLVANTSTVASVPVAAGPAGDAPLAYLARGPPGA